MLKIKKLILHEKIILAWYFLFFLALLNSCSQEKVVKNESIKNEKTVTRTAEQLVDSKKNAEMSYRELMNILGSGTTMVQQGILMENKQMIIEG